MTTSNKLAYCGPLIATVFLSACGGGGSDPIASPPGPPPGTVFSTVYTVAPTTFAQYFDASYGGQTLASSAITGSNPTTFTAPAGSKGIQAYIGDGSIKNFGFGASVSGQTLRISKLASSNSEVRIVVNFNNLPGVGNYTYNNCTPIYLVTGVTTVPTDRFIDLTAPATDAQRAARNMSCAGTVPPAASAFAHVSSLIINSFQDGPSTLTLSAIDSSVTPVTPSATYANLFTASTSTLAQYLDVNYSGVLINGTGAGPVTFSSVHANDNGLQVFMGDGSIRDLSAKTSIRLKGLSTTSNAQVRVLVNFNGLTGFGNGGNYNYDNCTAVYVVNTTASPTDYTVDLTAPNGASNGAACTGTAPSATQALGKLNSFIVQSFQPGIASLTLSGIDVNQ